MKSSSWEVFMICLVCLSLCGSVGIRSDDSNEKAQAFLVEKEKAVRLIADQATQNYNHTCDIVKMCRAENCSRRECSAIDSLKQNDYSCVYVNSEIRCPNQSGSTCSMTKANFNNGMVRIPENTSESELGTTICAQRELDSTFRAINSTLKLSKTISTGYFYNVYFGSVDGAFRHYPGREHLNAACGTLDPRIRPWYTGATSVLKDVVILLDTGSSMSNEGYAENSTSLNIGKNMTTVLVQTLTTGDRVTIIPISDSDDPLVDPQSQYIVPKQGDVPAATTYVQNLLNTTRFSLQKNGGPSNFTAGFLKTLSVFNNSESPKESLKIVILITDTTMGSPPSADSAVGILENSTQSFVYDLSGDKSSVWSRFAACQGNGDNQQPFSTVLRNPLLLLNSYFSFLARSRSAVTNSTFWSKPYFSASNLGNVITASFPAMSSDGLELLGVAGFDVQLDSLDPALKNEIEDILVHRNKSSSISRNPNGAHATNCSESPGYINQCSDEPEPFCSSPNSKAPSDTQLMDFICCAECTDNTNSSNTSWLEPVLGTLAGVTVLLVVVAIFWFCKRFRCKRFRRQQPKEDATQPTEDATELSSIRKYSFNTLERATNGFDPSSIIGKGAFGVVYKANIEGEEVAVKELNQPAHQPDDFELKILDLTSHLNLVKLKGTCFQPPRCFLVCEFVENGDLLKWLWPEDVENHRFLTWNQRRKIARGVACGLNYLHRELPSGRVCHLDIKPGNILLDGNFTAKLADFGISQFYEPGYTLKIAPVGGFTPGYVAPEVFQGNVRPNPKIDVYSYGMVLLQLMSGRKIDDELVRPNLPQWTRGQVRGHNFERVVDEHLIKAVHEDYRGTLMANCRIMIRLALRCLSGNPESRPEMLEVIRKIDGLGDVVDLSLSAAESDKFSKSSARKTEKNTDKATYMSGPLIVGKYERLQHSPSNKLWTF